MKSQGQHLCAICGYRHLKLPQRTSSGEASREICPSCGFEPGLTDNDQRISTEQWREQWVANGCRWFSKRMARPKSWNPIKELHSLLRRKRPVNPPVIWNKRINAVASPAVAVATKQAGGKRV